MKYKRELAKVLPEGSTFKKTKAGHFRIRLPNGRLMFAPGTPSDRKRYLKAIRATSRRLCGENNVSTKRVA